MNLKGLSQTLLGKMCMPHWINKMLLTMKLTAFIVLSVCLQVSARSVAQGIITLSEHNSELETVLQKIHDQVGYEYFFSAQDAKKVKVTISVKNAPINEVLPKLFEGKDFTYEIVNKIIVVKSKGNGIEIENDKMKEPYQKFEIHGKVTDSLGNPLVGASVQIKGTKKGVQTRQDGTFEIESLDDVEKLEISFTGYSPQVVDINSRNFITVVLAASTNPLDEVQIIAYGQTTKRLNTGAVTTVKSEDLTSQPVSDPLQALEGRVPGLQIGQSSGLPGKIMSVTLRGQNSIAFRSQPLYIIDGVPFFMAAAGSGDLTFDNPNLPAIGGASSSPLDGLNLNDIESIDILKDADATSIYGSRGANGVILITTKKGKPGKTRVNGSYYTGMGKDPKFYHLLNTLDYLQMRHEAFANDGIAASSSTYKTAYDINGTWDSTRYTDWQRYFYGGTTIYTDAQASFSGGSQNTQFLINSGFHRETTILPADFNDTKGSVNINLSHRSENNRFSANLSAFYSTDNNYLPKTSGQNYLSPDAPPIYNPDHSLNWANSTWTNPASYWFQTGKTLTDVLNSKIELGYQLFSFLKLKTLLGYNSALANSKILYPITSYDPAKTTQQSSSSFGANSYKGWIVEPQLSFDRQIAKGQLGILAGTTFQQQTANSTATTGTGYSSDALLNTLAAASTITLNGVSSSLYRYNAFFGRISYNWDNKYLINLSGRRDGSSRFGTNREFANFGSVGAAWIFSNEGFAKAIFPFLSFGKIRGSYGLTGNDQIGNYKYLTTFSPVNGTSYLGVVPLTPTGLPNPEYGWETTKKFEGGLELGFIHDRILFNADYYRNRSSSLLVQYPLPSITGGSSITENFPAVIQNSGLEFTVNTTNIRSKNFAWSTSINFTLPIEQAKLIAYPGLANSTYASTYVIGKPISIYKALHYTGVDRTTGLYTFLDYDKDGTINYPKDAQDLVFTGQQFYGGIGNKFAYKGFSLDIFFQFVEQKNGQNMLGTPAPGSANNIPQYVFNHRWTKPGDNALVQRLYVSNTKASAALTEFRESTGQYSNASYIRLKNVSLSYNFSGSWMSAIHLQSLKAFLQGRNLLTFTHYLGLDPENKGIVPPLRIITAGVQVSL